MKTANRNHRLGPSAARPNGSVAAINESVEAGAAVEAMVNACMHPLLEIEHGITRIAVLFVREQ